MLIIRRSQRVREHWTWAAAAALLWLSGCHHQPVVHPDRATVRGAVTFGDQPLPGGSVTFISTADPGQRATGILKSDGTFTIADVPIGPVRVAVDTEPMRFGAPTRFVPIPAKYTRPESSGFSYDVQPGENADALFRLD